jgi:lysine decarboxylase
LLASLDAARHNMWQSGPELFREAVDDARELEDAIDRLPGLAVLRPDRDPRLAGHGRDPLRTVVNVSATGWKGFDVEVFLRTNWQVEDEMADWFNIVLIQSPRDDPAARQRLLAGLRYVSENPRDAKTGANVELMQPPIPPLAMTPRQAALGRQEPVVVDQAVGRTCAEMVMFYPPGIPLLMPGETITPETLAVCRELLAGGAHCYASDVTLGTVRVTEVNHH